MINTVQLSMSIATMEGEIVDINVRLSQVVRQCFSRKLSGLISTWVTALLFIGVMWLVVGNSEDFVPIARSMWNHVIFWMSFRNQ